MAFLRLLLPAVTFAAASSVAIKPARGVDLITVVVSDGATGEGVPHPMVCISEFGQPAGAIGDSSGRVRFGGSLPAGTLHLKIKAPDYIDFDTTAAWPSVSEIRIKMKRRPGPPVNPYCAS